MAFSYLHLHIAADTECFHSHSCSWRLRTLADQGTATGEELSSCPAILPSLLSLYLPLGEGWAVTPHKSLTCSAIPCSLELWKEFVLGEGWH